MPAISAGCETRPIGVFAMKYALMFGSSNQALVIAVFTSRRCATDLAQELGLVVPVEMNLIGLAIGIIAFRHFPMMSGSPAKAQSVGIQSL